MDTATLVAIVGVGGTLVGSCLGGFVSFISSRSIRRLDWDLTRTSMEIEKRESLYSDFFAEINRLFILSMEAGQATDQFTHVTALEARIWLNSDAAGQPARNLVKCVMNFHEESDDSAADSYPKLRDEFLSICKEELRELRDGPNKRLQGDAAKPRA